MAGSGTSLLVFIDDVLADRSSMMNCEVSHSANFNDTNQTIYTLVPTAHYLNIPEYCC